MTTFYINVNINRGDRASPSRVRKHVLICIRGRIRAEKECNAADACSLVYTERTTERPPSQTLNYKRHASLDRQRAVSRYSNIPGMMGGQPKNQQLCLSLNKMQQCITCVPKTPQVVKTSPLFQGVAEFILENTVSN